MGSKDWERGGGGREINFCSFSAENAEKYYSVDDYEAEEEDEVSFKRGVKMDVLQKSLDGWWVVKIEKKIGLAPATFLKKVEAQSAQVMHSTSNDVSIK